ncbi:hypothetical protein ACLI09_06360 [Flavobacterium sp. RHBU_24]|uniref:hypothetical protein n=1 Tax=Flavobacterium sp. RHBU_24 TaxID=3391185 RepID=UPI003985442F
MNFVYRLLIIMALCAIAPAWGQVKPVNRDSIKEHNDSIYQKIQDYSRKRKFTKMVHKLMFRPVQPKKPSQARRKVKERTPEMQNTFNNYEGKIVRRIVVQTLDPFGYSITDTLRKPNNWVQNFGNRVHLKTKEFTIKNLLLFKRNEPLDSLLVKDSERLIRAQRYVRRVAITPQRISAKSDSVDVYIRVLDSWSLLPNGSASGSGTSFTLTERNFMGLGHQFENDFDKRFNTGETAYLARYTVPNIMNTYINSTITYQIWRSENSLKSFGAERDFYSAFTKLAGGIYVESRFQRDTLPNAQQEWDWQNFKSSAQDYWAGYAFKFYNGNDEEARTTRLITSLRYFNRKYTETPTIEYDSIGFYSSEKLYLASVGITSRKFVQDKFLFNYDIVEDIPIGKLYSVTFGMQDKNNRHRAYVGGRYAFGNYYKWGFLSTNLELGSYFYRDLTQQTTLRVDALYFTNIKTLGSWRLRHFIKPVLVFGDNRLPIYTDQLNINNENGIDGFSSRDLRGTKKLLLTLQTQSFSPWNLAGFRINPFANLTLGVIGNEQHKLYDGPVYAKIGMGILLYNDYLVFNSFQLSLAYYPNIPDNGYNIFKTNGTQNNDITLPDFQVGEPMVVPYQ